MVFRGGFKFFSPIFAVFIAIILSGCGAPTPDPSSADGQQEIIDQAEKALTTSDCATALNLLTPVYDSANTDNAIRLVTASAYGCDAGIDEFPLIGNIITNSSTLESSGFWGLMAKLFPSTTSDYKEQGAFLAIDALQSVLNTGVPLLASSEVNAGTDNVGSIYPGDRTSDSNIYMIFVGMAGIGAVESRNGSPNASYSKTVALPWTTATAMTAEGCGYAASILNFFDAIAEVQTILPSNEGTVFGTVSSTFKTVLDTACDYGLSGQIPPSGTAANLATSALNTWIATGCNLTATGGCPQTLRNRTSCTGVATDADSCAAAGIVNFINASSLGWQ